MTSAYTYRINNKSNYIDTINNNNIDLVKEETIIFKAKKNNLNKIRMNIDYNNNYVDNQEVLITIADKDKVIKEEKVRLNELETMQELCNELYEKEGLTDEVLDLQLQINKLRHEHNISDEKNRIYKNFVQ